MTKESKQEKWEIEFNEKFTVKTQGVNSDACRQYFDAIKDFIRKLLAQSVQEAKAEEAERIHKQIAKIAKYEMVDDKSKLSFTWLLMQMESEDHKSTLNTKDDLLTSLRKEITNKEENKV